MSVHEIASVRIDPIGLPDAPANRLPETVIRPKDVVRGVVRDESERFAATFHNAGIGIVEADCEGRVLRVNRRLCVLTGFAESELLGRTVFQEPFAEDADLDRAQFRRQVAGEIESYTIEKRIARRDGLYLWVRITSSTVTDARGTFLYAVRVQHDITDRKQAEALLAQRVHEQAALFAFVERLQHARTPDQVYQAGLEAILRALRCQRSAILLFDAADVMRFVAWRGLSDPYRQAVEGHSPWPRDDRNPMPVYVEDIARSDLPAALKQTVMTEGIGAVAFIPVIEGGRLLGKFMAYYDAAHPITSTEVDVAMTLARQLAFSLARLEAESVRRGTERAAQQLAAIVESSDDAIISKNLDGIITTWNRAAERLFGYPAAEAVGQPVTMLIPADRIDEEPEIIGRIRRGEHIEHFETARRRKDGSLIDIELTVSPVRDRTGAVVGASKIARDIRERRQAEAQLRESERQLQDLLAAIPAAIYTTDAAGKITYFNQAAVDLAGRTPTIGSDEWCVTWKLYWPDGTPLPHDQCPMAVALKEGRPIRNVEAVAERPDGTRVPFIPYPTPLRNAAGQVIGAINMLVDISERRQAETQQRLLLNELNHRVKNNMQMLQSLLSVAARHTTSTEAKDVLGDASRRIAAMAAAQRVLYGTTAATLFDAHEFINAVCETARQAFPASVRIACAAAQAELPNDIAMPLALILNELLTNAVKHGLNGAAGGAVKVDLSVSDGEFCLQVEDDGPGFDLEAVRKRSSGLQLVLGLARQLRGRFEVTRAPATRCVLHFPGQLS
jgi:PAS domain S-box-containing protein